MAAKLIQISIDGGSNFFTYPGGTGSLNKEAGQLGDTVFGQTFQSNEIGLIGWNIAVEAIFKGFAGYVATIKQQDVATTMTVEAMTLVSGKTFQIDDVAKRIWDRTGSVTPFVFFDVAVDRNAEVLNVDYLFGRVTFKSSFTVIEPVTVTGTFFTTKTLGKAQSFTLTQTADAVETSDFGTVQGNGGFRTFDPGLRTVAVDLQGVYLLANAFAVDLIARNEFIIELNPDGNNESLCRGIYNLATHGQSGDVGALEEETVSFALAVPAPGVGIAEVEFPFAWQHATSPVTTLPTAVKDSLDEWEAESKPELQYLPDGVAGDGGDVVLTDLTLTSGLDAMNVFNITGQGDGVLNVV